MAHPEEKKANRKAHYDANAEAYKANALGDSFHVEHMTPICRGGTNWPCNLGLACPDCNLEKGDKTGEAFLDQRADREAA